MPKPVTIRRSLLLAFVSVVVLLAAVLLGVTFLTARSAAEEQAARLLDRSMDEVQRSGQQYFQPVERILRFASAWREQAEFERDEDLQAVFDAVVTAAPQISAVRIEPYGAFAREDFANDAVRWSDPDVLAEGAGLGVTAYTPVSLPGGEEALVAVDVPLDVVSEFTQNLEVTPRGRVLMLLWDMSPKDGGEPGYVVVGLPADEDFATPAARQEALLQRARTFRIRYLQDAIRAFPAEAGQPADPRTHPPRTYPAFRFTSGGEAWWVGFREYDIDSEVRMADAVFIPESDLLGNRDRLRWFILGAALLAAVLAIGLAHWFARRAGQPIEALVSETERIRSGDFSPGTPIDAPIVEVRRLAEAHEEMRRALEQLVRMEHAMGIARKVQLGTFPARMPTLPGYQVFGSSLPAEDTGGDTYDVIGVRHDDEAGHEALTQDEADKAVLLLADATGHGIGPALSVSQVRAMLRMAVRLETDLTGVVREINEQLCADLPAGRFITAWFGILDPHAHTLTTFSAGQGPLLVYRAATDSFERGVADTPPLGLMEIQVVTPPPTTLEPGDIYFVLSDGFHEASAPDGELYGEERVEALLRSHAGNSPEEMLAALHASVDAFTHGAPPDDDRTGVIVKRT